MQPSQPAQTRADADDPATRQCHSDLAREQIRFRPLEGKNAHGDRPPATEYVRRFPELVPSAADIAVRVSGRDAA